VIFSDSSVPGEGEHKILEFIRLQRCKKFSNNNLYLVQDHYDPNTKHCIYGADADLIMLSLITHEPHFFIIRESLNENMWKKCDFCGQTGHFRDTCKKLSNPDEAEPSNTDLIHSIQFSIIKVHIIREYLELEFKNLKLQFPYDFERIIDDFVFLCFFVGNDFIPHLPSLKIREGAIDALLYLYKKIIITLDGYLTEGDGKINLARTEILLARLADVENTIFQKQLIINARLASTESRGDRSKGVKDEIVKEYLEMPKKVKEVEISNKEEINLLDDILNDIDSILEKVENNAKEEENKLKIEKLNKHAADSFQRVLKEMLKTDNQKKMEKYKDEVKLGEEGWKERYYVDKFNVSNDDHEFKKLIKKSYVEGICWVFAYYYNGCASWEWYYPFHYAPFASDLTDIKDLEIEFKIGTPFQPVEQLLSVLPPYSSHALPACLRNLMHNPHSEIADFYPKDVRLDINGQPYAWMGVNLVPFIEEHRIRKAVKKYNDEFTDEEMAYNTLGETLVFFHALDHFISKYTSKNYLTEDFYTYFSTPQFRTFAGKVKYWHKTIIPGRTYHKPHQELNLGEVRNCQIVSMIYETPTHQLHSYHLRKGVKFAQKVVLEENLNLYNKRNFKGDQAIELVRKALGYQDERNVEDHVRNEVFDRTYNNNRAIEYNPYEMDQLRKKRYHQINDNTEGNMRYPNQNQRNQNNFEQINPNARHYNQNQYNRQGRYNYNYDRNKNQPYDNRTNNYNNQNTRALNKLQNEPTPTSNIIQSNININNNNKDLQFNNDQKQNEKKEENKPDVSDVLDNILKSYEIYMGMNKK
jgi:5'-3' exoribonuclease 2